jgi:hypothetical protein
VEVAAPVRQKAFAACDDARWDDCEAKLDEAAALDPDSDMDVRVQHARGAVYVGKHPYDGGTSKEKPEKLE